MDHKLEDVAYFAHIYNSQDFRDYLKKYCSYMLNNDNTISDFYVNDAVARYNEYIGKKEIIDNHLENW